MHIVIIGNGIAGTSVARHCRKLSDHQITIISDESEFFFSRTALMYIYMGHMSFNDTKPYEDSFWKDNRIDLVHDRVTSIDRATKSLKLFGGGGISYDKLVIATGSRPNLLPIPGAELSGVQGLYHLKDLVSLEELSSSIQSAVVVGGGLIGVELAEMLLSRGIDVTMLIREKGVWASVLPIEDSEFVAKHMLPHGLKVRYETELVSIQGGPDGRVTGITCNTGENLSCDFVGITIGVSPSIDLAYECGIECAKGILVTENLSTSDPDIYAAGDCAELRRPEPGRRAVEPVWYVGKIMGETLARSLCQEVTPFRPGVWFNSAKFFDLEYQTYGQVGRSLQDGEERFSWESGCGQKYISFVFDKDSECLKGLNLFGVRARHQVFEKWIESKKSISFVIENFSNAVFDSEFSKCFERDLVREFNKKFSKNLSLKSKRGLLSFGSLSRGVEL